MFDDLRKLVEETVGKETDEQASKRYQEASPLSEEELVRVWARLRFKTVDMLQVKEVLREIAGRAAEKERQQLETDLVSVADHLDGNATALRSFEGLGKEMEDEARRRELAAIHLREWAWVLRMRKVSEALERDAARVTAMVAELDGPEKRASK